MLKPRKRPALTAFDIDHDVLRVGVLQRTTSGLEARFKQAPIPDGVIDKDSIQERGQEALSDLLKRLFKDLNAPTNAVLAASPDRYTALKKESFPPLKGKNLTAAIQTRAAQVTPFASDELSVGFVPVPGRGKDVHGILAALPLNILDTLGDVVKSAGGTLTRLEPSVFALANLLLARSKAHPQDGDQRLQLVVHLTYSRVGLALLHENRLLLARYGSAGVSHLERFPTYQLLTDEITATLQEYRALSKEPPLALVTGRNAHDPTTLEAVRRAEVEIVDGIASAGLDIQHQEADLEQYAILLGLAVGRLS